MVLLGHAFAQPRKEALMLASPVRLSGVVVSSDGRPLSDVWINHTGVRVENIKTNSSGQFDIHTRAPAIVFSKDGFQSKYWQVTGESDARIILVGAAPRMRQCGTFSHCVSLKGFMSAFCLPSIPGVNVSKQGNDVDYGSRSCWITTPGGTPGIQHAAGGMWGPGLPFDEDVWSARNYSERTYVDDEGYNIIDARGKSSDGKCWRVLGHVFETAAYRNVAEPDTPLLDRVLDGACFKPNRFRAMRRKP